MPNTALQLRYRRSGGIAGLDLVAQAPADELSAEQAGVAADLLADGPSAPSADSSPAVEVAGTPATPTPRLPGPPDQFSYELHVSDGDRRRTYHWADHEVPEAVRPLLTELNHRATPA